MFLGKDSHIKPEELSAIESAGNVETETGEGDDENDEIEDDEETEYESEPSFVSVSGITIYQSVQWECFPFLGFQAFRLLFIE